VNESCHAIQGRSERILAGAITTVQCIVVCCSVLQCAAECCSVLQFVAFLLGLLLRYSMLQCVAVQQCVAVCCGVL